MDDEERRRVDERMSALEQLRADGTLSDAEFGAAKARLHADGSAEGSGERASPSSSRASAEQESPPQEERTKNESAKLWDRGVALFDRYFDKHPSRVTAVLMVVGLFVVGLVATAVESQPPSANSTRSAAPTSSVAEPAMSKAEACNGFEDWLNAASTGRIVTVEEAGEVLSEVVRFEPGTLGDKLVTRLSAALADGNPSAGELTADLINYCGTG